MIPLKKIFESLQGEVAPPVQPKFPGNVEPTLHDPADISFARDEMLTNKVNKAFDDYIKQESQASKTKPEALRVEAIILIVQSLYEKLPSRERYELVRVIRSPEVLK